MVPSQTHSALFLAALSKDVRPRFSSDGLETRLSAVWAAATQAWPGVAVAADQFWPYLAERVSKGQISPVENVGNLDTTLRCTDLYLACACTSGAPKALARFEAHYGPVVEAAVARLGLDVSEVEDLMQTVRRQLFVEEPGARPKIAEYAGSGDLSAWLRVFALRVGIKIKRGPHESLMEDQQLLDLSANESTPELQYMKNISREVFTQAFREALASLNSIEQNVLRQHYLDRLSIDEIGAIQKIHRTSAARWLRQARESLLTRTKKVLMKNTRASRSECDSMLRQARSQFDITLRTLLK